MRPGKGSPWARQEVRPLRLEDIAARLGDQIDAIRSSLDGQEDVAVVDARDIYGGTDALLVATRKGILVTYPWSGAPASPDAPRLGRVGRRPCLDRADRAIHERTPLLHHPTSGR